MKLRNKKTGEIIETDFELSISIPDDEKLYGNDTYTQIKGYRSIKELSEDWEDYEGPKEYWYYDTTKNGVDKITHLEYKEKDQEIGNYFETKEEAEKAVEKLKAWKRLKDKGFRFSKDWVYRYDQPKVENHTYFEFVAICEDGIRFDDLDLLFGGEE